MHRTIKDIYFVLILLVGLSSCQQQQKHTGNLTIIDIERAYKKPIKELVLSEVVDSIEYIKLETKPGAFIGRVGTMAISENYVSIFLWESNRILLFSKKGEYLNDVGNPGKGPGEYLNVDQRSLTFSPDESSIFFSDRGRIIYMYGIDGKFIKRLALPLESNREIRFLSDGSLIVYQNRKFLEHPDGYFLLKFDNKLNLVDSMFYAKWDNSLNGKTYSPDMLFVNNNDIYFKQFFNDTVFKIDEHGSETPGFQISLGDLGIPSLHKHYMETWAKYFMIEGIHISNQYILTKLLGRLRVPKPRNYRSELVWYNRENQDIFMSDLHIKNDMDGIEFWLMFMPRNNVFWDILEVIDNKPFMDGDSIDTEVLTSQKYYCQLKELLAESDIEDNPIIRIFHMK